MRADTRQSPHAATASQISPTRRQVVDVVPADLHRRFADFRRTSALRTRVPEDLRQAVLDALGQGISMLAVRRDLGLTAKQVESWGGYLATSPVEVEPEVRIEAARVFEVADEPVVGERAAAPGAAGEALELRLGAWSIVIRSTHP
jgi:hypothetical protein